MLRLAGTSPALTETNLKTTLSTFNRNGAPWRKLRQGAPFLLKTTGLIS